MSVGQYSGVKIFISYRREDTSGYAGRIYDRLCNEFGKESVFFDVVAIPFGYDFKDYLDERLAACDYVLSLIGKRWMEIANEHGTTRISETDDILRLELAAALRRGIPVTPILIDGAGLPKSEEIPSELAGLCRRQALVLTPVGFHDEMSRLVCQIRAELETKFHIGASERRSSSQSNALSLDWPIRTPSKSTQAPRRRYLLAMLGAFVFVASSLVAASLLIKSIPRLFERPESNGMASANVGDAGPPAEPTSSGETLPSLSRSEDPKVTQARSETKSADGIRPAGTAAPSGPQPTKWGLTMSSPRKRSSGQAYTASGKAESASHEAPPQPSALVGQGSDCPGDPGCFLYGQK